MSSAQERAAEVLHKNMAWGSRMQAAALAAAGLLVDDDTASERSTAKKCWRCGGRGTWYPPDEWWHECYCDICEKGAAMTAAAYGESATDRPPDSPARPETPPDGTPVAPEPSQGDTAPVSGGAG